MEGWIRVASPEQCPPGSLLPVTVGNDPLVLANVDGAIYAVRDRCSHAAFPLSDGELEGDILVCRHHGARFDPASGAPRGLPAVKPVKTYPVEVRDDGIYIQGS